MGSASTRCLCIADQEPSSRSHSLEMSEKPTVFAAGYLIFRKSDRLEFLLMKHSDRWDLPKGHLDPGESACDAAKRELTEETGVAIEAVWTDPSFEFTSRYWVSKRNVPRKESLKELTIYLGRLVRPVQIACTEHPEYQWWDWNPPHRIQPRTIDPLLDAVENHFRDQPEIYKRFLEKTF